VKNCSPNCFAKPGYYSITESFMRQFLSSLKSFKAGTIDYYKFSKPIILSRQSSLLKRFRRTSEDSSLNNAKNIGSICSVVGPLSIIGQIDKIFSASAYLT